VLILDVAFVFAAPRNSTLPRLFDLAFEGLVIDLSAALDMFCFRLRYATL
jgi:hypothetical protein